MALGDAGVLFPLVAGAFVSAVKPSGASPTVKIKVLIWYRDVGRSTVADMFCPVTGHGTLTIWSAKISREKAEHSLKGNSQSGCQDAV